MKQYGTTTGTPWGARAWTRPAGRPGRPTLAVALGGGGAVGIAFHLGIIAGLQEEGVPVGDGPMVGVSAGSWAAAGLATATPLDAVVENWNWGRYRLDDSGRHSPLESAERLFGHARDARVTGVAVHLPSGVRVPLNGARYRLAEAVAASSSPPRLAAPLTIDGHRVYDAGVLYNACADLAPRADALLALAPLAAGVLGWQGLLWEQRIRGEVALWTARHRGRSMVVRPDRAVRAAGQNWSDIMDGRLMHRTHRLAREQGLRIAPQVRYRLGLGAREGLAAAA